MLAENKNGWKLLEYLNVNEQDITKYNVTGSYAILVISKKFLIGYNSWRKQWEFPAGGIEQGESAKHAAIRELFEETHQKIDDLEFKGLFKVQDNYGKIKYQAIYVGYKKNLSEFIYHTGDEMKKIYLWDLNEDIGYFDECDKKIAEIVFRYNILQNSMSL